MAETAPLTPQALLQKLEWKVLKRLDGALQGDYRTLFRGHGVDLADLREYQLHDDVRHIDWNVTARLTIPHVRQFTEERDLTAWFLLDLSPSIDFGSQRRKREVSEAFVAVMASAGAAPRQPRRRGALRQLARHRAAGQERAHACAAPDAAHARAAVVCRHRHDAAGRPDRARAAFDQAPLGGLHRLRLHQRVGLGSVDGAPGAKARRGGGAPVRPAGDDVARTRHGADAGRRDRRANLRRHRRTRFPPALRSRRRAARAGAAHVAGPRRRGHAGAFHRRRPRRLDPVLRRRRAASAAGWRPARCRCTIGPGVTA